MFCEKCGAQIPDGSKFCTACGAPLAAAPTSVAPVAPASEPVSAPSEANTNTAENAAPTPVNVEAIFDNEPKPQMGGQPQFIGQSQFNGQPQMGGQPQLNGQPQFNGQPQMGGQPVYGQPQMGGQPVYGQPPVNPNDPKHSTLSLVLGIVSIIMAFPLAWAFGIPAGVLAIVAGVIGLILSIGVRKASMNQKGTGALVCNIVGLILGVICSVCCLGCGATSCGVGYFGCVGTCIQAKHAINNAYDDLSDIQNYIDNLDNYGDFDFDDYDFDDYDMDDFENSLDELNDLLNQLGN